MSRNLVFATLANDPCILPVTVSTGQEKSSEMVVYRAAGFCENAQKHAQWREDDIRSSNKPELIVVIILFTHMSYNK